MPELATIERLTTELGEVRDRVVAAETEESDISREVTKAESDVQAVRDRAVRDQTRLDNGSVGSAKELEALQHEIASLAKRQGDLEEVELEILERLESTQTYLAEQRLRRDELVTELAEVEAARDAAFSAIDQDLGYLAGERERAAVGLPEDLVTLYTKLRADQGGIGAAPLQHGTCQGCRLQITPIEIGRIRAADPSEVLRCEECRRILVRTADSGL